jgi:hypothetical protein
LAEARRDALDRTYPLSKTYTAYTFIAVSALAFGAGPIAFFAVCRKYQYISARAFTRRGRV